MAVAVAPRPGGAGWALRVAVVVYGLVLVPLGLMCAPPGWPRATAVADSQRQHGSLPCVDLSLPFVDPSLPLLTLHCLPLTFHCFSLTLHCLSLTLHCLALSSPPECCRDMGSPNMFSALRMHGGSNHYLLPTNLLQRAFVDAPPDESLGGEIFGGGVVRVERSSSLSLTFRCLSLTFRCLSLPFLDLSPPFLDVSLSFH